jgi:peptidase E
VGAGVVLTGGSAGSLCWHTGGTTDSFGPSCAPWTDGLGFVPGSSCPHYDSEERRRPLYQQLVRDGALDPGIATDDGVGPALRRRGLHEALSDRPSLRLAGRPRRRDAGRAPAALLIPGVGSTA